MPTAPRHTLSRAFTSPSTWGSGVANGVQRLVVFVRERFPLLPSLLGAALFAGAIDVVGARLMGQLPRVDGVTVLCAGVIAALFFILRVVDELRDEAEDATAHPGRPLVRGATRPVDVIVAAALCGALATAALAWVAFWAACGGVAVILATVALQLDGGSTRIRGHALLTLALHQAMVPLWAVLVLGVRRAAMSPGARGPVDVHTAAALAPLLLLAVLLTLLFELGRKVHPPHDENPHDDSYSRLWGPRAAAAGVALCAAAVVACVAAVVVRAGLPVWPVGVAAVWAGVLCGTAFRLAVWLRPGAGTAIAMSSGVAPLFVYVPLVSGALCG